MQVTQGSLAALSGGLGGTAGIGAEEREHQPLEAADRGKVTYCSGEIAAALVQLACRRQQVNQGTMGLTSSGNSDSVSECQPGGQL